MTLYEFYISYIFTGKALLVSTTLSPLKAYLTTTSLCIEYPASESSIPFEIPYETPITFLSRYGIKITLVTDPIYISASMLTGAISIPVPEPDKLPF